jgi:rhodanese-related sulfurtransferase
MSLGEIGTLAAIYPAVWGLGQLFTGAWSDRIGRKGLIVSGMWVQALGIGVIALSEGFSGFAFGAVLLGAGTAMVYPTLLAAIGDVAHPTWRASSVGVYRLWRDLGYAVGALLAGAVADAFGLGAATWTIAALTFASGGLAAFRMRETLVRDAKSGPAEVTSTCIEPESLEDASAGVILDVRSREEFALGHVEGAINVPIETLAGEATSLPRDSLIVTVCGKGGGRSERAAAQLRALGFDSVRSLCGGTQAWMQLTAQGTRPWQ